VRKWSSASFVKLASKSTVSYSFAALLRYSLAAGLKRLEQAAQGGQRGVHGVEQRQIAQLGTTVNVALRKDVSAHYHGCRLTSGLRSQNLLDFNYKGLSTK
jgi:hypothetical protein